MFKERRKTSHDRELHRLRIQGTQRIHKAEQTTPIYNSSELHEIK